MFESDSQATITGGVENTLKRQIESIGLAERSGAAHLVAMRKPR